MKTFARGTLVALIWLAMVPGIAGAQALGSIAGVVRDTSGAVMPGVTVEAASPALIEKVRTVVTDSQGLFTIVDLRPGTYSVTFTLTGFNTVKREGIDLPAGFTATVNGELRVGALEETITVTGASPTVDTRNVVSQRVFSRDVLDAIPTATGFASRGYLIPGMVVGTGQSQDVGGSGGERGGSLTFHGSKGGDFQPFLDGMSVTNGVARSSYGYYPNNGIVQEVSIEGGGQDAEHEFSGVYSNLIPKDGSNTFRGFFLGNLSTHGMQAKNLSQDIIDRGLTAVNSVKKYWDLNPTGGGPIKRDRLWFYSGFRHWGTDSYIAGLYYNQNPTGLFPPCSGAPVPGCTTPGEQAFENLYHYSIPLRLTWQASQRNKFTAFGEHQYSLFSLGYGANALTSPEALNYAHHNPQYVLQTTWSSPVTSRFLLQAAWGLAVNNPMRYRQPDMPNPNISAITELSTGFAYRANPGLSVGGGYGRYMSNNYTYKASAAYVTGTHTAKAGIQVAYVWDDQGHEVNNALNYQFRNGRPAALQQFTTDADGLDFKEGAYDLGLYLQDQWVMKQLTLNLGARMDRVNAWVKPQHEDAGRFAPARDYGRIPDVPSFWNISPRVGASYDVFGNGKTAIKATLGRFVEAISSATLSRAVNPIQSSVFSVTRVWHDDNNDFVPDCDLNNSLANGECNQISDLNFGNANRVTTRYDDAVIKGFQRQGYNWETSVSFQHELLPNVSVNTGYFRRWFGNQRVTQNTALKPSDYTTYCVTTPVDSRLPGGGGQQLCGFYDINPGPFSTVINQNVITTPGSLANGRLEEVYDGVDVTANARLPQGIVLSGGFNTGRTRLNYCYASNLPNVAGQPGSASGATAPRNSAFCDVRPPFLIQAKGFVVYPLPIWGLQTSLTLQSIPGNPIYAGGVFTSSQILPSLGRNLSAGATGQVILDMIPQGEKYTDRLYQVDFRTTKIFKVGRMRVNGMFDLYNLFNVNTVLTLNTRYGPSWLAPSYILPGRLAKVGVQLDF